jgi:hypothetical protein
MSARGRSGTSSLIKRVATGPRTAAGKMRSRLNARRHGLAVPIFLDATASVKVEKTAREIAGPAASSAVMQFARLAAEGQLDVIRCRQARCSTLEAKLNEDPFDELLCDRRVMYYLLKRRWSPDDSDSAMPGLDGLPEETLDRYWNSALLRLRRTLAKELMAIDRYERRALSRRNRALQHIDCQRLIEAATQDPG